LPVNFVKGLLGSTSREVHKERPKAKRRFKLKVTCGVGGGKLSLEFADWGRGGEQNRIRRGFIRKEILHRWRTRQRKRKNEDSALQGKEKT